MELFTLRRFSIANLLGLILLVGLCGCSTSQKNTTTDAAEILFKEAQSYNEAGRYDIAVQKFNEVKNKFPYSSFATEAELAIADSYFKRQSYPEAQISYQNFRELHPRHAKIDYVIYQTAMSYYKQLPSTDDRDLTLGNDVIYHLEELLKRHPQSQYATDAKTKRDETYERLMNKELYIADFYFKQKKYSAALFRYETALSKYPGFGLDPRAHFGAAMAAKLSDNPDKQKTHATMLIKKYPQSNEAKKAEQEGLL